MWRPPQSQTEICPDQKQSPSELHPIESNTDNVGRADCAADIVVCPQKSSGLVNVDSLSLYASCSCHLGKCGAGNIVSIHAPTRGATPIKTTQPVHPLKTQPEGLFHFAT